LGRGFLALAEAGWMVDGRTGNPRTTARYPLRAQAQRTMPRRWLLGELDDQVVVPVRLVCDVLGISFGDLGA
jgi:hypothetical protein